MAVIWFHAEERSADAALVRAPGGEGDALDNDAVTRRAYEIWQTRGRPEGQAQEFRREAEDQLLAEHAMRYGSPHSAVDAALWREAQRGLVEA
jgi:hypothetical protein